MSHIVQKRRTWKRAPVKRVTQFIKENAQQRIEKIVHNEKSALLITYKNGISLKDLTFLRRATTYLSKANLPFSTLLNFDHTKQGYRGIWTYCEGKVHLEWREEEYRIFGEFLGKMHLASAKYKEPSLGRPPIIFSLREKYEQLQEYLPSSFSNLESILDTIEKKWPLFLPTGLVHTDLFPSNILFYQNAVSGILQNHNMQIDVLLYDLTSIIKSLYFSETTNIESKENAFFSAYTSFLPLSEEEVRALPVLTSAKLLATTLSLMEKHLYSSEYRETHLNSAAISLVHAEKALHLYS